MALKRWTRQAQDLENSHLGSSEASPKAIKDMAAMQLNMQEMIQKQIERRAKFYENMMLRCRVDKNNRSMIYSSSLSNNSLRKGRMEKKKRRN